jgi:hypothetical protein
MLQSFTYEILQFLFKFQDFDIADNFTVWSIIVDQQLGGRNHVKSGSEVKSAELLVADNSDCLREQQIATAHHDVGQIVYIFGGQYVYVDVGAKFQSVKPFKLEVI